MGAPQMDPLANLSLPPGFRFYPTDEELMVQYLCRKVAGHQFPLPIIGDIDLYKFDPWVLPSKALFGEKEWYFFSPRERKYPNGSRPNRVAGSGYWKATGTDKVIKTQGRTIGIKKALVFYTGKAPKGAKTNWIMHEFRLSQSATTTRPGSSRLDDWVLCRIYRKSSSAAKPSSSAMSGEHSTGGSSSTASSTQFDDVLDSIPEIDGRLIGYPEQGNQRLGVQSFGSGNLDWAALAGLTNGPGIGQIGLSQAQLECQLLPPLRHVDSPQEVQSGIRAQRINTLEGFMAYSDPLDPFGIRYPAPMGGFGFGQ